MGFSTATVKTVWNAPAVLQAPLRAVFKPAATACLSAMDKKSPLPDKAGVRILSIQEKAAVGKGTGLASMFERGRTGGYPINPKGEGGIRRSYSKKFGATYKFRGPVRGSEGGSGSGVISVSSGPYGGVYSHVKGGAEAPHPFMMEVAVTFKPVFYDPLARAAISRSSSSLAGLL